MRFKDFPEDDPDSNYPAPTAEQQTLMKVAEATLERLKFGSSASPYRSSAQSLASSSELCTGKSGLPAINKRNRSRPRCRSTKAKDKRSPKPRRATTNGERAARSV